LAEGRILISPNDTTILAMLSRYPNMPVEEAKTYIEKIENEENVPICEALVGIIQKEDLNEESLLVFKEFMRWSDNRTTRTRQEQWTARKREQETKLSIKMNDLHRRGLVTDETMVLYGISGPLPEHGMYSSLSVEEKQLMWEDRMSSKFGPNWRSRFTINVRASKEFAFDVEKVEWAKEGF
jgi:hypothetical protein